MMNFPDIGNTVLRRKITRDEFADFQVTVVRNLDDYQKVVSIRSATFMSEQACPFDEEFDGNDLNAMHLLAFADGQAIATLRLRWFAGFGKVERVCIHKNWRGSPVVKVILAHAFEIASRKGFQIMTAQIQSRLWPVWSRLLKCKRREGRAAFDFSNFQYTEIDIPIPRHPNVVKLDMDPYVLIRPEGDWDKIGILEQSVLPKSKGKRAA